MSKIYTQDSGLAFLTGELTSIESKVFEKQYGHINYKDVVPVSNQAGEYATSVTYFYMNGSVKAKFIGSNSLDVPIAEINRSKVVVAVEPLAVGYQYSDMELGQAIHLGMSLPEAKASVARRGVEELIQQTCMLGSTSYNLPGFLNNSAVTSGNVVAGVGGTTWVLKTPNEIIFDVTSLMSGINEDSEGIERPNMLALPIAQYNYISSTPRSTGSDQSIKSWIVANSDFLSSEASIISLAELNGAGATSTDRMVAYTKDIDKVVFHMPKIPTMTAPLRELLGFKVAIVASISGVEYRFPGSARYADGI